MDEDLPQDGAGSLDADDGWVGVVGVGHMTLNVRRIKPHADEATLSNYSRGGGAYDRGLRHAAISVKKKKTFTE